MRGGDKGGMRVRSVVAALLGVVLLLFGAGAPAALAAGAPVVAGLGERGGEAGGDGAEGGLRAPRRVVAPACRARVAPGDAVPRDAVVPGPRVAVAGARPGRGVPAGTPGIHRPRCVVLRC